MQLQLVAIVGLVMNCLMFNFYAYFDEQLNDPENRHVDELTRMSFYDPSGRKFTAEMLLNKYRDELCIPYDMI